MNAYLITNLVNGKKYVGIAKNPDRRWGKHISCARGSGKEAFLLHKAIAKYRVENFSFEIVASARNWEDLCATERLLIMQHRTFWRSGLGYNMTAGGDGMNGYTQGAETRAKIGSIHRGRKLTAEHKAKLSAAKKGRKPSAKQLECLAAHRNTGDTSAKRAKLREFRLGKSLPSPSPETRERMRVASTGKCHTDEARKKMRIAARNRTPEHLEKLRIASSARSVTEETRARMSAGQKRRQAAARLANMGDLLL